LAPNCRQAQQQGQQLQYINTNNTEDSKARRGPQQLLQSALLTYNKGVARSGGSACAQFHCIPQALPCVTHCQSLSRAPLHFKSSCCCPLHKSAAATASNLLNVRPLHLLIQCWSL
jgi:hypothetical protein